MKFIQKKIANRISKLMYKKQVRLNFQSPVISFTFDDAPLSAFEIGGRLLDEFNYKGTYYISLGREANDTMAGKMFTINNLEKALSDGHELGCHTYYHYHTFKINRSKFDDSITKNQEAIDRLFPGYEFSNFSYPFGEVLPSSKKIVGNKFSSARTSYYGIEFNSVDMNRLKSVGLYKNRITLEIIKKIIDEAKRKKAWIIFYTHDVRENPTAYGCEPKFLRDILELCSDDSLAVLNMKQTIEKFF